MITSAIKKERSVCCSISLNSLYGTSDLKISNHRKKKKKSSYIVSLYCWCQLLDHWLLLYANIFFKPDFHFKTNLAEMRINPSFFLRHFLNHESRFGSSRLSGLAYPVPFMRR